MSQHFAVGSRLLVSLAACLAGVGCSRDLAGSSTTSDLHPGQTSAGTGGVGGTTGPIATGGGTGLGGITVAGTGGASGGPIPACPTISTQSGQLNRCGRTFGVAYSPDGRFIATATETTAPNVHIWSLPDGAMVHDLEGHGGDGSFSVAFSPDGKTLATAGNAPVPPGGGVQTSRNDPTVVKLWDVASGALLRDVPATCGSYAATAQFSHDGARLVTGGAAGQVEIWNVADATVLASIPTGYTTYQARFSLDDGRIINAGTSNGGVWNSSDGAPVFTIPGLGEDMNDVAYSPDGTQIATTGAAGRLQFFDSQGHLLQSFVAHDVNYTSRVVWVDSNHVVSDDWGGNVKSWTRDAGGNFVASGGWSLGMQTLGMAVSPDGSTLAVAGSDGFVFLSYPPAP